MQRPLLLGDLNNDCRVSDFDLQQVAGSWGKGGRLPASVIGDDGVVDLHDFASLAKRNGATCAADLAATVNSVSGDARFRVEIPSGAYGVFEPFDVKIYLESGSAMNGFDLKLNFVHGSFDVTNVALAPALRNALVLGPGLNQPNPQTQKGGLSLGFYKLSSTMKPGDLLATVTMRPTTVGPAILEATDAQALNQAGDLFQGSATGRGEFAVSGEAFFMPVVMH